MTSMKLKVKKRKFATNVVTAVTMRVSCMQIFFENTKIA